MATSIEIGIVDDSYMVANLMHSGLKRYTNSNLHKVVKRGTLIKV